jgi:hypothetical protein
MRLRLALLAAAVLLAPGFAAADAPGPAIATALRCYLPGQEVRVTGSGFQAADRYSVTLDRTLLGTGLVRADGTIAGRLSSGGVPAGMHQVIHRVVIADGALQAGIGFRTTAFGASYAPPTGNSRTVRVRYTVDGIGLSAASGALVWLHYVDPHGVVRLSAAIGRTRGVCGSLQSIRHRLFPLRVSRGAWQLQFDLRKRYTTGSRPRIVLKVAVGA